MNLDEAIQKFKAHCEGEGDFDELALKELIVDEAIEAYKQGYIAGGIDQINNAVK